MPIATPSEITSAPATGSEAVLHLDRSARFPEVHAAPHSVVASLQQTNWLVVGAGSVGMPAVELTARLGVGGLFICDRGRIKAESILTHPVTPADLGRAKASLAAARAKAISPDTRVFAFDGPFEALSASVVASADIVVLASDNLACEVAVARACTELCVPLIQASVDGRMLVGQLRSLANPSDATGPCLPCAFDRAEWEALDRDTRFSCEGGERRESELHSAPVPTMSPPHLCGLAANLAVMEGMRRVLGIANRTASYCVDYRGYEHAMTTTKLERRRTCPMPHMPTQRVPWPRALGQTSLRELLSAAGVASDSGATSIEVDGYAWCTHAFCACPRHPVLDRFVRASADIREAHPNPKRPSPDEGGDAPTCAECGGARCSHPFYTHRCSPARLLAPHLDRPLTEIGATAPSAVYLRGEGESRLFFEPVAGSVGAATASREASAT